MGIIIAVWMSRLEAAVLLSVVKLAGRLMSVLLPPSTTAGGEHPRDRLYVNRHHRHPGHTGPGLWYITPRAALISWTVGSASWAAHRRALHAAGHRPVTGLRAQ